MRRTINTKEMRGAYLQVGIHAKQQFSLRLGNPHDCRRETALRRPDNDANRVSLCSKLLDLFLCSIARVVIDENHLCVLSTELVALIDGSKHALHHSFNIRSLFVRWHDDTRLHDEILFKRAKGILALSKDGLYKRNQSFAALDCFHFDFTRLRRSV